MQRALIATLLFMQTPTVLRGRSGSTGAPGVAGSDRVPVTSCLGGDVMQFDGSNYVCAPDAEAAITHHLGTVTTRPGSGLIGGAPSGVVNLRLIDCVPGEAPHFTGGAWVCSPDRTVPSVPISSSGHLQLTNTSPSANARAIRVTSTDPTACAISATNASSTGGGIRATGYSVVGRGEVVITGTGSLGSGINLHPGGSQRIQATLLGTQAFSIGDVISRAEVTYTGTTFVTDFDAIGFGPGAVSSSFLGGDEGAFPIGLDGTQGTVMTCTQLCSRHGFNKCVGSWNETDGTDSVCSNDQIPATKHAVCLCAYL